VTLSFNLIIFSFISRSERNRKERREQPVRFLNTKVEDSKLSKEEKEKESTNCAFTQGFKLYCGRSVRSAALNRLLDSTASFGIVKKGANSLLNS